MCTKHLQKLHYLSHASSNILHYVLQPEVTNIYKYIQIHMSGFLLHLSVVVADSIQTEGIQEVSSSHEQSLLVLIQQHYMKSKISKRATKDWRPV